MHTLLGDTLRITAWTSVANVQLNISMQFRSYDGCRRRSSYVLRPPSDVTPGYVDISLDEGEIESLCIFPASGTLYRGQCYVTCQIFQGSVYQKQPHVILLSDYVTSAHGLSYPPARNIPSIEGPGYLFRKFLGASFVNADWSYTIPANTRMTLHAAYFAVSTNATVADRYVALIYVEGGMTTMRYMPNISQGASTTRSWVFSPNGSPDHLVSTYVLVAFSPIIGTGGNVFQSRRVNFQAGDQFVDVSLYLEQLLMVP